MREQKLVLEVLAVSHKRNPDYTHEQHLAWALGILAQTVLRKNHMDNIVFSELNYKLNTLLDEDYYTSDRHVMTNRNKR